MHGSVRPPPKNYARAWKHICRTWCQGQGKNFLLETTGPTRKKTKEVFASKNFHPSLINATFYITGKALFPHGGGKAGVNVVGLPGAQFCQQMIEKLFTKNVTRLPNGIALLMREGRALQQLAHQNPLDLTRVAITWHIKSLSVSILTPHTHPFCLCSHGRLSTPIVTCLN